MNVWIKKSRNKFMILSLFIELHTAKKKLKKWKKMISTCHKNVWKKLIFFNFFLIFLRFFDCVRGCLLFQVCGQTKLYFSFLFFFWHCHSIDLQNKIIKKKKFISLIKSTKPLVFLIHFISSAFQAKKKLMTTITTDWLSQHIVSMNIVYTQFQFSLLIMFVYLCLSSEWEREREKKTEKKQKFIGIIEWPMNIRLCLIFFSLFIPSSSSSLNGILESIRSFFFE